MQRTEAGELGKPRPGPNRQDAGSILPSRLAALDQLRAALSRQVGPLLLTGHPGVGKTWLIRRLRAAMPAEWRWVTLDLSSSITPPGLGGGVLRGLGMPTPTTRRGPAHWRAEIEDALVEAEADHRRWVLVADEAHAAADDVLEELRVLGNRLGEPGGFGGLILVGQTSLVRRLERKPLDALAMRLATRVHLRPLGIDELRDGLVRIDPTWGRDSRALERLHRDTGGIPRLAFHQAIGFARLVDLPAARLDVPRPELDEPRIETNRPPLDLTAALPVRPPLQVGEGVVEVGWDAMGGTVESDPGTDADLDSDAVESPVASDPSMEDVADEPSPAVYPGPDPISLASEGVEVDGLVHDRYAALQAWSEWSRSKELETDRHATDARGDETDGSHHSDPTDEDAVTPGLGPDQDAQPDAPEAERSTRQGVRVEGQHGFAPYSQLFSRLRLPRDVP